MALAFTLARAADEVAADIAGPAAARGGGARATGWVPPGVALDITDAAWGRRGRPGTKKKQQAGMEKRGGGGG